jgi:hypothetical protein
MKRRAEIPYMGDGRQKTDAMRTRARRLTEHRHANPAALALGEARTHRLGSSEEGIAKVSAPMLELKSFRTAAVTLAGAELAHRIRNRQLSIGLGGPLAHYPEPTLAGCHQLIAICVHEEQEVQAALTSQRSNEDKTTAACVNRRY